ncbi:MAG: hypothetical protein AB7P03_27265 [Kofleriaceae bacterium]
MLLGAAAAGCARGAPPGFSGGASGATPGATSWTFPLVDPLADGRLITPVYLDGRGPFLFAIDPDAERTVVDRSILYRTPYIVRSGLRVTDENDVSHPRSYVEVTSVRIGDLTISLATVELGDDHAFDGDGRQIRGIIGRDVIADSLVFGFDRERAIAWLSTQEAFQPPAGAVQLAFHKGMRDTGNVVVRKLVTAQVGGKQVDLHVDLGAVSNQLRTDHWRDAQLRIVPNHEILVDEAGTRREVTSAGIADQVTAGVLAKRDVMFVPYDDKRWPFGQLEGTLGLEFFRDASVAADWHHQRFYVTPRSPSAIATATRLARWGRAVPACPTIGCATITVTLPADLPPSEVIGIASDKATSPDGWARATVIRDPAAEDIGLEVVLAATSRAGTPLPPIAVSLPATTDELIVPIEPRYGLATLQVIDVSPFPRPCVGGCVVASDAR